jgi:hypothetical protein
LHFFLVLVAPPANDHAPRGLIRVPEGRNVVDTCPAAEAVPEATTEVAPSSWGVLAAIDLHGCDRRSPADPDRARRFVAPAIDAFSGTMPVRVPQR